MTDFPKNCWQCGPSPKWKHFMRCLMSGRRYAYCDRCKTATPL